jgi:hypothetical protein
MTFACHFVETNGIRTHLAKAGSGFSALFCLSRILIIPMSLLPTPPLRGG